MNEQFDHPVLDDLHRTLEDIAETEVALDKAREKLLQDIADLPTKIGDNKDLSDEVFHHLYWFNERVPAATLKQVFQRFPLSQTRKENLHTAIRNARVEVTCEQCEQTFLDEVQSRSQLNDYREYGYVDSNRACKTCQDKARLHTEEQYHQWEVEKQQYLDRLRTMPYRDYLQTTEWQERRKRIMKKAGFRCQVCNAYGVQLNVHHRTYERRGCEWDSDLLVLCYTCHEIFHTNGKLARD